MGKTIEERNDAKKVFRDCGTCSRTFAHLLNREFGHVNEVEEQALNPLAGGIMNQGYQCGMLWGAALAAGAEAYRQNDTLEDSVIVAVSATQEIIRSFVKRSDTVNCKEIIGYDLTSVFGMARFMLKVTLQGMDNSHCFNLAEQWAPEAIEAAKKGLAYKEFNQTKHVKSCASDVVKKLGGSEDEMAMAAGFSGGLGLSGNACGALSAAIWKRMLDWCRENPDKNPPYFNNKIAKKILKAFNKETDNKILCSEICGRKFTDIEDHSKYIRNDGCKKLMNALANSNGNAQLAD